MARYVVLVQWTEQGVRNFADTLDRASAAEQIAESTGAKMMEVYWTLGAHDIVAVFEADDDESMTAAALKLSSGGNVRTTTMRAFGADEMRSILSKAG